jgi:cell division protein FtsI/penicillin-binding protein 2
VVDKLKGPNWQEDVKPIVGKKFISDEAVRGITAMMVQASEHGESKKFDIKGFKIAGKTGTAQIPIAGHYDEEKTNASFIGFAPADNPKFVMLVTLREPQTSQWASETAAPLWYNIASDLFLHYGIQPEN